MIEYVVKKSRAVIQKPGGTVDEFIEIPCCEVSRHTGGMAWHIGKYADEATADAVARVLHALSESELA